jgi:hypothetical protein
MHACSEQNFPSSAWHDEPGPSASPPHPASAGFCSGSGSGCFSGSGRLSSGFSSGGAGEGDDSGAGDGEDSDRVGGGVDSVDCVADEVDSVEVACAAGDASLLVVGVVAQPLSTSAPIATMPAPQAFKALSPPKTTPPPQREHTSPCGMRLACRISVPTCRVASGSLERASGWLGSGLVARPGGGSPVSHRRGTAARPPCCSGRVRPSRWRPCRASRSGDGTTAVRIL